MHDLSFKHYLDLYITDSALKVSWSLYWYSTSVSHGVGKYFPWLWGTGISDAIFVLIDNQVHLMSDVLSVK